MSRDVQFEETTYDDEQDDEPARERDRVQIVVDLDEYRKRYGQRATTPWRNPTAHPVVVEIHLTNSATLVVAGKRTVKDGLAHGRCLLRVEWAPSGAPGDSRDVPSEFNDAIRNKHGAGLAPQLIRIGVDGQPYHPNQSLPVRHTSPKLISD